MRQAGPAAIRRNVSGSVLRQSFGCRHVVNAHACHTQQRHRRTTTRARKRGGASSSTPPRLRQPRPFEDVRVAHREGPQERGPQSARRSERRRRVLRLERVGSLRLGARRVAAARPPPPPRRRNTAEPTATNKSLKVCTRERRRLKNLCASAQLSINAPFPRHTVHVRHVHHRVRAATEHAHASRVV